MYQYMTFYITGNNNIHRLTKNGATLRIELEDWEGLTAYAEYSNYVVADKYDNFRLTVSGYSGTAGM